MGIFDFLNDPDQAAQNALAFGLLSGKGSLGNIIGRAGMQAMLTGNEAQNDKAKRAYVNSQTKTLQDDIAEKQRLRQAAQDFWATHPSPASLAASQPGGPSPENAASINAQDQMYWDMGRRGLLSPMDVVKATQKDNSPIKLGADESLLSPKTLKVIAQGAPKKPDVVREFEYGQANPSFTPWLMGMKKAGANSTEVKINNALGGGLAKGVAEIAQAGQAQASGAIQGIQTADQIVKAIDSNKVLAGPGATFALAGLQIGQVLGVGGKSAEEVIANTRSAINGLAQSTIAARAALKGQGQVSDFEGKLLEKAASGNINDLTAPEIRQIAVLNKRLSQQIIVQHNKFIDRVKANRDPEISGLADLYSVEPPKSGSVDWGDLK